MKRGRSVDSLETSSSEEQDVTDVDQDYAPGAVSKRRRVDGRRRSKTAPKDAQRDPKTPQASTQSITRGGSAGPARATFGKNAELASAISAKARLPPCDLGAIEMVTFFPLHLTWPELGLRLYRNDWDSRSIAKAMLHARNKLDWRSDRLVEKRRAANRKQVLSNGKYFFDDDDFTVRNNADDMTPVTTYNASAYTPRKTVSDKSLFTAKLVDVARGVVNWPKGEDRGIVTQAIEYAVRNRQYQLTTADIPQMALQKAFQAPADSLGSGWDQNAVARSEARIQLTGNYREDWIANAFEDASESFSEGSDIESSD